MSGKLHKTEALFDKVENTTLQKLEALESASLLLDERLSLKDDTRQTGLSLAIGQKGSGAERFYSKLSERQRLKSWRSLISDLKAESAQREVPILVDGILAYVRSDCIVWLKVQRTLSEDNLDLACKYAIDGLKLIDGDGTHSEVLDHAVDVLQRLKLERHSIYEELSQLKGELQAQRLEMKKILEEKDQMIAKLEKECEQRKSELEDKLAESHAEHKAFEKMMQTYQARLDKSEKLQEQATQNMKEITEKAEKMFREEREARTENKKKQNTQTVKVSVVQLRDVKTPRGRPKEK